MTKEKLKNVADVSQSSREIHGLEDDGQDSSKSARNEKRDESRSCREDELRKSDKHSRSCRDYEESLERKE